MKLRITKKLFYILFFSICISSCDSNCLAKKNSQNIKLNQIRYVIRKSGFIELPLKFDANNDSLLKSHYSVDFKGNDSLLFDSDIYTIIGFFPDTTDYYAFLFHTVGDMLYPTIMTISKQGEKIDRQIICAGGCSGHATLDVISCYDSVWVNTDLEIASTSRVMGTVETNDSIPKSLDICNKLKVTGFLEKNGKIKLDHSKIIDCNE